MGDDVGIYYLHRSSSAICTGDCTVKTVALEEGARSMVCSPSDTRGDTACKCDAGAERQKERAICFASDGS